MHRIYCISARQQSLIALLTTNFSEATIRYFFGHFSNGKLIGYNSPRRRKRLDMLLWKDLLWVLGLGIHKDCIAQTVPTQRFNHIAACLADHAHDDAR